MCSDCFFSLVQFQKPKDEQSTDDKDGLYIFMLGTRILA